jgi:hypothetical protein
MPLVPALVLLLALGLCFIYGSALAGNPELLQLRTLRELCWALLILQFGSPGQRRQLRLVLLCRQAAVARRALRYQAPPAPAQKQRAVLCDSCRAKTGGRRDYRLSRRQVEDAWRQAEIAPTGRYLLGMISKHELREQYPPPAMQLPGREEPGGS